MRSQGWGYARIMAGTIFGGILGFYVMHRVEISYKAKWDERLRVYEEQKMKKEKMENEIQDNGLYFDQNPSQSN